MKLGAVIAVLLTQGLTQDASPAPGGDVTSAGTPTEITISPEIYSTREDLYAGVTDAILSATKTTAIGVDPSQLSWSWSVTEGSDICGFREGTAVVGATAFATVTGNPDYDTQCTYQVTASYGEHSATATIQMPVLGINGASTAAPAAVPTVATVATAAGITVPASTEASSATTLITTTQPKVADGAMAVLFTSSFMGLALIAL